MDINQPQSRWYQGSIVVKLVVITVLVLVLLLPQAWIQDLIDERQQIQREMQNGVSGNWAGPQIIQGPLLAIPYSKGPAVAGGIQKIAGIIYVLPKQLSIKAALKTEPFESGAFDATVYSSSVNLNGEFEQPDLVKLGIEPQNVIYSQAHLMFGVTDIKGLRNNPIVNINGQNLIPEPSSSIIPGLDHPFQVAFNFGQTAVIRYSYKLDLKGSSDIKFMHTGKTTDVDLTTNWKTPASVGRYLPDVRDTVASGSHLRWRMMYYNRPYPQQWLNDDIRLNSANNVEEAQFGISLQEPVNEYRKVMRTNKYATLIILLTFVSLFLTELIRKQNVHLFNYVLIGAAMVVYYVMLLSFAEQIGYNFAYLVASGATIGLVTWFTASLLGNRKAAALFGVILVTFYTAIFIIIQMEAYALLVGSITLFLIIAALMYFSRKISWEIIKRHVRRRVTAAHFLIMTTARYQSPLPILYVHSGCICDGWCSPVLHVRNRCRHTCLFH